MSKYNLVVTVRLKFVKTKSSWQGLWRLWRMTKIVLIEVVLDTCMYLQTPILLEKAEKAYESFDLNAEKRVPSWNFHIRRWWRVFQEEQGSKVWQICIVSWFLLKLTSARQLGVLYGSHSRLFHGFETCCSAPEIGVQVEKSHRAEIRRLKSRVIRQSAISWKDWTHETERYRLTIRREKKRETLLSYLLSCRAVFEGT